MIAAAVSASIAGRKNRKTSQYVSAVDRKAQIAAFQAKMAKEARR